MGTDCPPPSPLNGRPPNTSGLAALPNNGESCAYVGVGVGKGGRPAEILEMKTGVFIT